MTVKELHEILTKTLTDNPADGGLEVAYWTGAREPEFVQGVDIVDDQEDDDEDEDDSEPDEDDENRIPLRYLQFF